MKKILFLTMALVALASCTKDQTVARPEGAVIGFENAFVNNTTRAAADINAANLADFGVYGTVAKGGDNALIFTNQKVEKVGNQFTYSPAQYWVDDAEYTFAAFAPYTDAKWKYAPTTEQAYNGTLTFDNAAAQGEQDLIFAAAERTTGTITSTPDAVGLTFSHLLSRVAFKFNNAFAEGNNISLKVYNVKVTNAAAEGTMAVADGVDGAWTAEADDNDYVRSFGVAEADEATLLAYGESTATEHFYLIPVQREYVITFNVDLYQAGIKLQTYNHEVKANINMEKGKNYSVNASLTPENVNPSAQLASIEFKIDEVESWDNLNAPVYPGTTALVSTQEELVAAFDDDDVTAVVLGGDITLGAITRSTEDPSFTIERELTIDLNGCKLSATSTSTGKNYNLFFVKEGALTVKNGTIEIKHTGENMGWSSSTNVFHVEKATLNLDGVTAKNLGGSDMGFVAHLNNWGECTLNVNNSTLESNYVAVRLFNSGNDMNNVTIKNSTLNGGNYAFWVHNYTVADHGTEAKAEAHKALLNLDLFNTTNTFVGKNNTPIRFGFTDSLYFGLVTTEAELSEILADGWSVILAKDIVVENALTLANEKMAVINLNGKTLSAVDSATGSYGLITNKGNLTVAGPGKLELTATNNREWNAYSSVISNTVGGNLTVEGGVVIEHLGGTDMAYGIDNLTNGKGTVAVTTVKDATVKSPYRAIRQFLNGIEATNELYVKAGATLEGANKGIFFHDPSTKANTGKLVVEDGAYIGSVYLFVTDGSTEWPVEVSIADSAVAEGGVTWKNVPAGYIVTNKGGIWVVDTAETASSAEELNAAISNAEGEATICLAEGTYEMPSIGGKDITIVGTEGTIIKSNKANLGDGNLTLDGVTITAGSYNGFQHSGVVTYNNATIKGQINCYGVKDIFNNCTFELNNAYVWTYGSDYTEFNNCTFNTNGKAILIYNEGAGPCNVKVNGCKFNATAGAKAGDIANQNCAAIELNNYKGMKHTLTTSNNTYSENFSGEWRIKCYYEGAPITVNGVEYTYIALDGKKMTIDADKNVTVVE